jgi:hypothetical protein
MADEAVQREAVVGELREAGAHLQPHVVLHEPADAFDRLPALLDTRLRERHEQAVRRRVVTHDVALADRLA